MNISTTKLFNNILLVVGFIALALLMYSFGFENIFHNILKTGPWFWALVLIWFFVYLFNALSFFTIIRDGSEETMSVSFKKTFAITVSGFAINVSNPAGIAGGEPYRILQLKPHIGVEKATSSVILYNMMHFMSHFVFWLLTIPVMLLTLNMSTGLRIGLWFGFGLLILLCYLFFKGYKKGMVFKTVRFVAKIPFLKERMANLLNNHHERLLQIDENISDLYLRRKKDFLFSLLWDLISRVISCVEILIILMTMQVDINFADSVIIYSLSTLVANILFFSPMQLGTREGGYMLAVGALRIAKAGVGVYISIITRIREFVWIGIGLMLMRIKIK